MIAKPLLSPLAAAALTFLGSFATIAGAWWFELIERLEPCPLCLEQRWPFYLAIPLALLALGLARAGRAKPAGAVLGVISLLMLYGAGLGAYHAGIEWGLWPGPASCGGGGAIPTDAGSLLESLSAGRVPSCAEAPWRLFGLSLAGYNVLISLGLALVAAAGGRTALMRR